MWQSSWLEKHGGSRACVPRSGARKGCASEKSPQPAFVDINQVDMSHHPALILAILAPVAIILAPAIILEGGP